MDRLDQTGYLRRLREVLSVMPLPDPRGRVRVCQSEVCVRQTAQKRGARGRVEVVSVGERDSPQTEQDLCTIATAGCSRRSGLTQSSRFVREAALLGEGIVLRSIEGRRIGCLTCTCCLRQGFDDGWRYLRRRFTMWHFAAQSRSCLCIACNLIYTLPRSHEHIEYLSYRTRGPSTDA
jgi:hypothetical protein